MYFWLCAMLFDIRKRRSLPFKKAVAVWKHFERNRKEKDAKFCLILIESHIHWLARYYKTKRVLPPIPPLEIGVIHSLCPGCIKCLYIRAIKPLFNLLAAKLSFSIYEKDKFPICGQIGSCPLGLRTHGKSTSAKYAAGAKGDSLPWPLCLTTWTSDFSRVLFSSCFWRLPLSPDSHRGF